MNPQSLDAIIWQLVAAIPHGHVASYGMLAKMAGYPNHARYVGRVLKHLPATTTLPWHRVVNAKGEIAFAEDSHQFIQQKTLLQAEGIVFKGNKLSMRQYGWQGERSN